MAGTVGTNLIAQVGFIVKDVETTKRKWAEFLGVEVPETQPIGDYAVTEHSIREIRLRKHTAGWLSSMWVRGYSWN